MRSLSRVLGNVMKRCWKEAHGPCLAPCAYRSPVFKCRPNVLTDFTDFGNSPFALAPTSQRHLVRIGNPFLAGTGRRLCGLRQALRGQSQPGPSVEAACWARQCYLLRLEPGLRHLGRDGSLLALKTFIPRGLEIVSRGISRPNRPAGSNVS